MVLEICKYFSLLSMKLVFNNIQHYNILMSKDFIAYSVLKLGMIENYVIRG